MESITLPFIGATLDGIKNSHFGYIFGASDYTQHNVYYDYSNRKTYVPSSLKTVVITNETYIPSHAFYNCSSIKDVTIPDSVTGMGVNAFSGCTALYTVYDGVKYVGDANNPYTILYAAADTNLKTHKIHENTRIIAHDAFSGCKLLESIEIPESVITIGDRAFYGCTSLNGVVIPNSVTDLGAEAFYNCDALKTVVISNALKIIKNKTFADCSVLKSVTMGSSVTSIGSEAFSRCSFLNGVYIKDIAAWCGISFASNDANPLYYAKNLYLLEGEEASLITELVIPEGVSAIRDYAFINCTPLTSVIIPASVTSIGDYAFSSCSALASVTIPDSIESIGENAFYHCKALTEICIKDIAAWCEITFANAYANPIYYAKALCLKLNVYADPIENLIIPDGVTSINPYAFVGYTVLRSVTIPESVISIGEDAFYGCSSLASATIPNSVMKIGQEAFTGCNADLYTTYDSGKYVGDAANPYAVLIEVTNKNCTGFKIHEQTQAIASHAFLGCSRLTSIVIPNAVTAIDDCAFYGCSSLESVTIGASVKKIGEYAFYNCSALKSVAIPSTVTEIGDYTFANCSAMTDATIPSSVKVIGNYAFYNCSALKNMTIPSAITSIGDAAF
jgi:hypothetical protein